MSKLTKQVNFWLPEQMLKDLDEVATIELIDRIEYSTNPLPTNTPVTAIPLIPDCLSRC